MKHSDFHLGQRFVTYGAIWQVTDLGTRTVIAIEVKDGWMNGPPYAVAEVVFDEHDQVGCDPESPNDI